MYNNLILPLRSNRAGASENSSDFAQTKSPPWTHPVLAADSAGKRHQALQESIKGRG